MAGEPASRKELSVDEAVNMLKDLYEKKNQSEAWKTESPPLPEVMKHLLENIKDAYSLDTPIDLGGAGIIWKVLDLRSPHKDPVFRALKMPRPKEGIHTSIEDEAKALLNVRHQSIIPVHYVSQIETGDHCYSFFVMDFVQDGEDMLKRTRRLLKEISTLREKWHQEDDIAKRKDIDRTVQEKMSSAVSWLVKAIRDISSAVAYLHSQHIIHFDIKPANILVDANGNALLADLGYAKTKGADSTINVRVGFTEFYAHEDLTTGMTYSRGDRTGNRRENSFKPTEFRYEWDVFAFGKSILHMLGLFHQRDHAWVSLSYPLDYLHVAACRMLDGKNGSIREADLDEAKYYEEWRGLTAEDFGREGLRYRDSHSIRVDMEKLAGDFQLEHEVPELAGTNRARIQTDGTHPAPFTQRVRLIVNHPVFLRLRMVPQLGLSSLIYPTATHTRFEHSLGVFSYTCEYIKALWYDQNNPLFRQWVSASDLRAVLAAALLHDLGHFPLAHDIEAAGRLAPEGHKDIFDHISLGRRLIESQIQDGDSRTIEAILRDTRDGWGVKCEDVTEILAATKRITEDIFDTAVPPKAKFLANILSGSLDADKLDYLIRDSHACHLPYGNAIDLDRLFRTLTTSIRTRPDPDHPDDPKRLQRALEISVYEKGKSAAESIGFARYLMYQAVYSHHTARAIRVMLDLAASRLFNGNKRRVNETVKRFEKMIGVVIDQGDAEAPLETDTDDILKFIAARGDETSKSMVALLRGRKIYKRIITVHQPGDLGPDQGQSQYARIVEKGRSFMPRFRRALREAFERNRDKTQTSMSPLKPGEAATVTSMLETEEALLLDIPTVKYGSPMELCIIPELEGLKRNDDAKMHASDEIARAWRKAYGDLMVSTSKIRIYCHPDISDKLTAVLGYEGLNDTLTKALGQ